MASFQLNTLSQSSLQDYVDCARRFQLRYLDRLSYPAIESEPAARVCRVVWKKAKEIAVSFNGAPREPAPEPQEQRQTGRQERRQSARRSLNAPMDSAGWRLWPKGVQDC